MHQVEAQAERPVVEVTLDDDGFWPISVHYEGVEYLVEERVDYYFFPDKRLRGIPIEQYIFETSIGQMCLRRAGLMFWLEWVE